MMKFLLFSILLVASAVVAQDKTNKSNETPVAPCACCALEETTENLSSILQIASDTVTGQRIIIRGRVFLSDGKTPAANVIMYLYHTNSLGVYGKATTNRKSQLWWHGYNRGWLKTEIRTIRPAPYPGRDVPAHIHCSIKSPTQTNCYGVHDFVFTDDPLVTDRFWYKWETQGMMRYAGVTLKINSKGIAEGTRDITLLPQYHRIAVNSGPNIGEDCPAFDPQHLSGPDQGTRACPMCKYGYQQGVLAWINTDDFANMKKLALALEREIEKKGVNRLRAFIIYMNPSARPTQEVERLLKDFIENARLKFVAVTYVPTATDLSTATLYKINPDKGIRNTLIVYRHRVAFDKFINLDAQPENLSKLLASVERAEKEK